jgi:hypothetical protein
MWPTISKITPATRIELGHFSESGSLVLFFVEECCLLREIQQRLSRSLSLITETIMSNVLQTLLFTYFYFFVELAFVWFIIYSLTLLQEKVLLTFTDLVRMVGVALMLFSSSLRLGCCHIQQVFFVIVYDHHENTLSHLLLIN